MNGDDGKLWQEITQWRGDSRASVAERMSGRYVINVESRYGGLHGSLSEDAMLALRDVLLRFYPVTP